MKRRISFLLVFVIVSIFFGEIIEIKKDWILNNDILTLRMDLGIGTPIFLGEKTIIPVSKIQILDYSINNSLPFSSEFSVGAIEIVPVGIIIFENENFKIILTDPDDSDGIFSRLLKIAEEYLGNTLFKEEVFLEGFLAKGITREDLIIIQFFLSKVRMKE